MVKMMESVLIIPQCFFTAKICKKKKKNLVMSVLGVTPYSRGFDASMGGAGFNSKSHSRIFAGCYDHAILAIRGCSNV